MNQYVALAGVLLGGTGIGAGIATIIVKLLSRNVDQADAQERRSNATASDVETLRKIIAEVRESEARKAARIDSLETRLDKLEERERHALTRAAVHEAWDQMAFAALLAMNPQHPPPPPLRWELDGDEEHEHSS